MTDSSPENQAEQLESYSSKILEIYGKELDKDERIHHALEESAKHPPKIAKLYEREELGHLKEEIVDLLLLAFTLKLELEVDKEDIDDAAEHFIDKIDTIYTK